MVRIDGSHLPRWRSRYRGSAKRFRDQQRNQSEEVSFLILCFSSDLRFISMVCNVDAFHIFCHECASYSPHSRFSTICVLLTFSTTSVLHTHHSEEKFDLLPPDFPHFSFNNHLCFDRFCQKTSENVNKISWWRLSKRIKLEQRYLGWLKRWPLCNWEVDSACSSPPPDLKCFFWTSGLFLVKKSAN